MSKRSLVTLTASEQSTLHACAWKHDLKYERCLEPAGGVSELGPLNTGTLIHHGIAEVYRTMQRMQLVGLKPTKYQLHEVVRAALRKECEKAQGHSSLFEGGDADDYRESQREDEETASRCLDLFVEYIALPRYDRYAVLGVEVPFSVPILTRAGRRDGDLLEGVMDVVFYDRLAKGILHGEHKSTAGDASTYDLHHALSHQSPLYVYALKTMFGELALNAYVLNVLRKSTPKSPSINKDGSVSIAKVDTTKEIYAAALDDQGEPDWLGKAREAVETDDPKEMGKAQLKLQKQLDRWDKCRRDQQDRYVSLPTIDRYVCQHEETISHEHVRRAQSDAWSSARLIRMFRRGALTPWRNGGACQSYGRLCAYYSACEAGVREEGELLTRRDARHPEVVEAREEGSQDMLRVMEQMGILR